MRTLNLETGKTFALAGLLMGLMLFGCLEGTEAPEERSLPKPPVAEGIGDTDISPSYEDDEEMLPGEDLIPPEDVDYPEEVPEGVSDLYEDLLEMFSDEDEAAEMVLPEEDLIVGPE